MEVEVNKRQKTLTIRAPAQELVWLGEQAVVASEAGIAAIAMKGGGQVILRREEDED